MANQPESNNWQNQLQRALRNDHNRPLEYGLPQCSGVALGIERLMMCLYGFQSIDQVMGFTAENS